ncbi:hypothetical protein A3I45_02890 [Candidatus Uhrbacteria bacterium RIFCSPLOWO2_02_FULL_53_10]|uniref:Sortilin N-terminal domain-containing protein n=1 Tax=Candidatus Uhrbacteria bacterium RIFCSPLOWO2_02_FULL_53_10 TaxID=1802411 RepID=A0A1F7VHT5_9BACT|nr:MAG: hypothetical protein A3I45_02890 [Candidatus Uhrbacteria bacterium RIFCSPLOWO2_02_FULL_53_10]
MFFIFFVRSQPWSLGETINGASSKSVFDDPSFDIPADPNQFGWAQSSGPLGGTVIRMIPHQDTVWASLYSGGVYELQKNNSWKQIGIGNGISENRGFDIVVDPTHPNIAYVPEMIGCVSKTKNNGAHWIGLCDNMLGDISADNFSAHTLTIDPNDSKIIYVPGDTHDGTSMLVVSIDGGNNWERRFVFDQHYDFNHLYFFNSRMYLGTIENGVLESADKGKSWTALNAGLDNLTTTRFLNFKNNLYLLGSRLQFNSREGGKVYKLSKDGSSWLKVDGLRNVTGIGTDNETLFVGTGDSLLLSSKDGFTFDKKNSQGLPQSWIGEIVSLSSKIYVGVHGNGIYVSADNGKTFKELNDGMVSVATREVHVNPNDENEIYVGTWDRLGFYWSKNGGKTYKRMALDYNIITIRPDPNDFARVYLGGDQFIVGNVSKDGGKFIEKNKPGGKGTLIKSIAVDPKDSRHILVGVSMETAETPSGVGLWESRDQGQSWTRAKGINDFAVYSILFHPDNSNIVYASALGSGVFKSNDSGRNFVPLGDNSLKYTYRLAMSAGDSNVLVAISNVFFAQLSTEEQTSGKYGGIFQSKDGGETWRELTSSIRKYGEDQPIDFIGWLYNFGHMPNYEMVLIDPKDANHLIIGHHGENIVVTRDGGAIWEKSLPEQMVPGNIHNYAYCLGSSSDFKEIYACTCGRGLWRGILDKDKKVTWDFADTVYAKELKSDIQPRNAEAARQFIMSGAYNHQH